MASEPADRQRHRPALPRSLPYSGSHGHPRTKRDPSLGHSRPDQKVDHSPRPATFDAVFGEKPKPTIGQSTRGRRIVVEHNVHARMRYFYERRNALGIRAVVETTRQLGISDTPDALGTLVRSYLATGNYRAGLDWLPSFLAVASPELLAQWFSVSMFSPDAMWALLEEMDRLAEEQPKNVTTGTSNGRLRTAPPSKYPALVGWPNLPVFNLAIEKLNDTEYYGLTLCIYHRFFGRHLTPLDATYFRPAYNDTYWPSPFRRLRPYPVAEKADLFSGVVTACLRYSTQVRRRLDTGLRPEPTDVAPGQSDQYYNQMQQQRWRLPMAATSSVPPLSPRDTSTDPNDPPLPVSDHVDDDPAGTLTQQILTYLADILQHDLPDADLAPASHIYNLALQAALDAERHDAVTWILETLAAGPPGSARADIPTYNILIAALVRRNRSAAAELLYHYMVDPRLPWLNPDRVENDGEATAEPRRDGPGSAARIGELRELALNPAACYPWLPLVLPTVQKAVISPQAQAPPSSWTWSPLAPSPPSALATNLDDAPPSSAIRKPAPATNIPVSFLVTKLPKVPHVMNLQPNEYTETSMLRNVSMNRAERLPKASERIAARMQDPALLSDTRFCLQTLYKLRTPDRHPALMRFYQKLRASAAWARSPTADAASEQGSDQTAATMAASPGQEPRDAVGPTPVAAEVSRCDSSLDTAPPAPYYTVISQEVYLRLIRILVAQRRLDVAMSVYQDMVNDVFSYRELWSQRGPTSQNPAFKTRGRPSSLAPISKQLELRKYLTEKRQAEETTGKTPHFRPDSGHGGGYAVRKAGVDAILGCPEPPPSLSSTASASRSARTTVPNHNVLTAGNHGASTLHHSSTYSSSPTLSTRVLLGPYSQAPHAAQTALAIPSLPSAEIHNVLLGAFIGANRIRTAHSLYRRMLELGVTPNGTTYYLILTVLDAYRYPLATVRAFLDHVVGRPLLKRDLDPLEKPPAARSSSKKAPDAHRGGLTLSDASFFRPPPKGTPKLDVDMKSKHGTPGSFVFTEATLLGGAGVAVTDEIQFKPEFAHLVARMLIRRQSPDLALAYVELLEQRGRRQVAGLVGHPTTSIRDSGEPTPYPYGTGIRPSHVLNAETVALLRDLLNAHPQFKSHYPQWLGR
ncbi:hypothetical protein IWQ60_006454 [Tieghemiomyces parasiticus]|uniref:Pentatricopeptide repeat-containing protein n=1 Tax=Tieghemiomyces parasiticus TaxID=78921 RepID=A0A9W8A842_9FUNG|nr:hypothetical protein IWQ60_006454 [Tieghemiomyces parasiticus]